MTLKPASIVLTITLLAALTSSLFADTVSAPSANAVSELIAQLGDDDYLVRANAQDVLISYGNNIKSELEKALATVEDPEIYQRLQFILKSIPLIWDEPGDEPELSKFIQEYRHSDVLSKMIVLDRLRRLPCEYQIKVLDRIIRKEQNNGLIVFAAMTFWYWLPEPSSPQYVQLTQAVNDNWKESKHPALKNLYYLVNYKQLRSEANIWFDKQLQSIAELNRTPTKSLDLIPEYVGTILAEFARRKAESMLTDDELAGEKRINFTAPRFGYAGTVTVNGVVQYQFQIRSQVLSSIRNPNASGLQLNSNYYLIVPALGPLFLLRQDMSKDALAWLNWETSNQRTLSISDLRVLANFFHENGYHKVAADVLEQKTLSNSSANKDSVLNLSPFDKGRLAYYRACQAQQENNPEKQWEYLQESIKENKLELDSLIMQWELCQVPANENKIPAITDDVRKQVEDNIENTLQELDTEILNSGDSFELLNQYAWLAVKTNRHLDKAFLYAKEAVDSEPSTSAFLDTLAHVYAAQGDIDKAIEIQMQAVESSPVSQIVYNVLLHFKELKEDQH